MTSPPTITPSAAQLETALAAFTACANVALGPDRAATIAAAIRPEHFVTAAGDVDTGKIAEYVRTCAGAR